MTWTIVGKVGRMASPRLTWLFRDRSVRGFRLPSVVDIALSGAVVAIGLAEAVGGTFAGPVGLAVGIQAVSLGVIAFRRIAPLPAIAISAAVYLPHVVAFGSPGSLSQLLAGLILLHAVGRFADSRSALAGVAIGLLLVVIQGLRGAFATPEDWVFAVSFSVAAAAIGVAQRSQVERVARLAADADEARRARRRETEAALDEERARIARDLHDVVSHNVGLIVLQAGGARRVLATQPERTRTALGQIESMGRETLAEMRQLVGVLRGTEATSGPTPVPRLEDVDGLVQSLRDAGLVVEVQRSGGPARIPAGIEAAGYRIIQEGLTNARTHAPGSSVHVAIERGDDSLMLRIVNDAGRPPTAPADSPDGLDSGPSGAPRAGGADVTGHGLIGMRERVRLYGGTVVAGPTPDGGFSVAARLPVEPPR